MSKDELQEHFCVGGGMTSELVITVGNGPDERPRNKSTLFVLVLLKILLNMEKVLTVAFAECDSKRHPVERCHVGENRALSQGGKIDSHTISLVKGKKTETLMSITSNQV